MIQGIARVGASLSLNIPYEIGVEQTAIAEVCLQPTLRPRYQSCTNVYQEWPGIYMRLYAWYQLRRVKWCGRWIPYVSSNSYIYSYKIHSYSVFMQPCRITWSSRHTWNGFTFTWYITSSGGRNILSSHCYLPQSPECEF